MCIPHEMWYTEMRYTEMHTAKCFNFSGYKVVALDIRTKQIIGFIHLCFSSNSGKSCQMAARNAFKSF